MIFGKNQDKGIKLDGFSPEVVSIKDNVSTDDLNKLVDLSNSFGALGSKLTGAGFGGAIVTLVKKELVEELKKYILDGYPNAKFI